MTSDDGFSNYLANLVFNHMLRVGSQFQSNKEGQAAGRTRLISPLKSQVSTLQGWGIHKHMNLSKLV